MSGQSPAAGRPLSTATTLGDSGSIMAAVLCNKLANGVMLETNIAGSTYFFQWGAYVTCKVLAVATSVITSCLEVISRVSINHPMIAGPLAMWSSLIFRNADRCDDNSRISFLGDNLVDLQIHRFPSG